MVCSSSVMASPWEILSELEGEPEQCSAPPGAADPGGLLVAELGPLGLRKRVGAMAHQDVMMLPPDEASASVLGEVLMDAPSAGAPRAAPGITPGVGLAAAPSSPAGAPAGGRAAPVGPVFCLAAGIPSPSRRQDAGSNGGVSGWCTGAGCRSPRFGQGGTCGSRALRGCGGRLAGAMTAVDEAMAAALARLHMAQPPDSDSASVQHRFNPKPNTRTWQVSPQGPKWQAHRVRCKQDFARGGGAFRRLPSSVRRGSMSLASMPQLSSLCRCFRGPNFGIGCPNTLLPAVANLRKPPPPPVLPMVPSEAAGSEATDGGAPAPAGSGGSATPGGPSATSGPAGAGSPPGSHALWLVGDPTRPARTWPTTRPWMA